jgi:hypothetical protein
VYNARRIHRSYSNIMYNLHGRGLQLAHILGSPEIQVPYPILCQEAMVMLFKLT